MTGVNTLTLSGAPRSALRQWLAAADGMVGEAEAAHHGRIVEVASVEDQGRFEDFPESLEVRAPELLPLGDDGKGVRTPCGLVGVLGEREMRLADINSLRLRPRHGIVGLHPGAGVEQEVDERARRCFPHVVGIRLE